MILQQFDECFVRRHVRRHGFAVERESDRVPESGGGHDEPQLSVCGREARRPSGDVMLVPSRCHRVPRREPYGFLNNRR